MNERATAVFDRMDEKVICDQPHPNFVCRLLVFGTGMKGPVSCFHIDAVADGGGILTYKMLDCEPNIFSRIESKVDKEKLTTKDFPLSPAKLKELSEVLAEAKEYYLQNRYHSYECTPRREHYLLEFQILGRYFYYDFEGREPATRDAGPTKPIPLFLQKLVQFCEKITRS
ncbi:MAG: hypothetical protein B7Z80_12980 [Rhodospirillales bacterium 20-64-7]|nr:MAG: hypothetical protein B7Z80_12980 [Rhodospirillales bacterium 20-64-7]